MVKLFIATVASSALALGTVVTSHVDHARQVLQAHNQLQHRRHQMARPMMLTAPSSAVPTRVLAYNVPVGSPVGVAAYSQGIPVLGAVSNAGALTLDANGNFTLLQQDDGSGDLYLQGTGTSGLSNILHFCATANCFATQKGITLTNVPPSTGGPDTLLMSGPNFSIAAFSETNGIELPSAHGVIAFTDSIGAESNANVELSSSAGSPAINVGTGPGDTSGQMNMGAITLTNAAPTSSTSPCTPNAISADDSYVYHCNAAGNGSTRTALSTW